MHQPADQNVTVNDRAQFSPSSASSQACSTVIEGEKRPKADSKRHSKSMIARKRSYGRRSCEQGRRATPGLKSDAPAPLFGSPPPPPPPPFSGLLFHEPVSSSIQLTEEELLHDIHHFLEVICEDVEMAECFMTASEDPPITPESLFELEIARIINNAKLRHDVNFDRDLHFRPNLDGTKGRQKIKMANEYWKALQGELMVCAMVQQQLKDPNPTRNESYWYGLLSLSLKRLPKIFRAVRDILKSLVPDKDQKMIRDRLDVDLLMQEIQNGVCDLDGLASWLSKVLKKHCAPMRDGLVDKMQREIRRGAAESSVQTLANGLRQLLGILEMMKLDVANHQIRHMRPILIDDTINFHIHHHKHRIAANKIDAHGCRMWLENEIDAMTTDKTTPTALEALTSGLLRGIMFGDHNALCPGTFYLDIERIKIFRLELHAMVCQAVCAALLCDLVERRVDRLELDKATTALHLTITAIMGTSGNFSDRIENIAAELMRIVCLLEGRDPPFDSTLLDFVEQRLETDLQPTSGAFESLAQDIVDRLLPKLQVSVNQHVRLSAFALQDKLLPPTPFRPAFGFGAMCTPVSLPSHQYDPDNGIINRMTHTIVLHWQIWADLVYLNKEHCDPFAESPFYRRSPPPVSPTIPISQAVYKPGGKWLPVRVHTVEIPNDLATASVSPDPESQGQSPTPSTTGTEQDEQQHQQAQQRCDTDQSQPA